MHRPDVYERQYDESTHQTTANPCPECDGRVTMTVAETVCDDCGLVLAEQGVDTGPEWRNFQDQPAQERTGASRTPSRHDPGGSRPRLAGGGTATGTRLGLGSGGWPDCGAGTTTPAIGGKPSATECARRGRRLLPIHPLRPSADSGPCFWVGRQPWVRYPPSASRSNGSDEAARSALRCE